MNKTGRLGAKDNMTNENIAPDIIIQLM